MQQALDSANDYMQKLRNKEWEEKNLAGLNMLMEQQKEQKAKEKRRATFRIVIGVFFLAILLFGLRRKTKKTAS